MCKGIIQSAASRCTCCRLVFSPALSRAVVGAIPSSAPESVENCPGCHRDSNSGQYAIEDYVESNAVHSATTDVRMDYGRNEAEGKYSMGCDIGDGT